MSDSGHTPGPWHWRDERIHGTDLGGINIEYGDEANPEVIATLARCRFEGDEVADAKLIAAAPDLLDALRVVEAHTDREWISGRDAGAEALNRVRLILHDTAAAAIEKATGR